MTHDAEDSAANAYTDSGVGTPDGLERLWAPYRAQYITKAASDEPFVDAPKKSDEDSLIIARGTSVYAIVNLYPYNAGHLMVIPYRKVAELEALTDEETAEMSLFVKKAIRTLKHVSSPQALNVGLNLGKASGGSIGEHLHVHVVPRWSGDANFMTVLGGAKVLPMLLRDTRELLAQGWAEIDAADERKSGGGNA